MPTSDAPGYSFGPFRLEPAERRLLLNGEPMTLAPKVLDTLVVLLEADGRLVPKDALMQRLWPDTVFEEVNLASNISLLRKTLGDVDGTKYIETVPKSGYRFIATVDRATPAVATKTEPGRRVPARLLVPALFVAVIAAVMTVRSGIWRSNAAPGAPSHRFVRATFDGNVLEAVLSPDGTQVASVLGGQPMRLMVRDMTTGSNLELARGEFMTHAKWSADGSAVVVALLPE